MTPAQRDRRGSLTSGEMSDLYIEKGWHDGRDGYLFCRIEAQVDMDRLLRAEVTWMDDSEEQAAGAATVYYDPMITLESNRIDPNDPDRWITVDAVHIPISGDEAAAAVSRSPDLVLSLYEKEIDSLRLAPGVNP